MTCIASLAAAWGAENIEVTIPMLPVRRVLFISYTSSQDKHVPVPCRIVEDRYKVSENYKVTLESKVPGFGHQHFYTMDLESMIRSGHATVRVVVHDGLPA